MTTTLQSSRKPLRLWPLAGIAVIVICGLAASRVVMPEDPMPLSLLALIGGVASALLILVWWLLLSRARWSERLGVIALIAVIVAILRFSVDPSIAGAAQFFFAYILGTILSMLALAVWALFTPRLPDHRRWHALVACLLLIAVAPALALRTDGVQGGGFIIHWRWTPTAEEVLLARGAEPLKPLPPAPEAAAVAAPMASANTSVLDVPAAPTPIAPVERTEPPVTTVEAPTAVWPGFRGPNRDSVVRGVRINTDWSAAPPEQIWRRPIGPGWSSFAVRGDVLYTQEQRGNDEIVAAYRVSSGEPVWRHADAVRFYESNGGAGPRSTPTLHKDRVYAMGATGILNALDARTGKKIWSTNTTSDTSREVPFWGISSSPLVVGDIVIVSVYGTLAGYDIATGKQRWVGPQHGGSYSSPHLLTIDGVTQVLILSAPGAVSVDPADGKLLWEHRWEGGAIIQPAVTEDGDILINAMAATGGVGTRRLSIKHDGATWTPEEKWTSNGMKPYFNDYVIHKGHAYGFDNNILACIDLADGKRKWKGGRYGNGQMVLLVGQDLLLVTSEEGELALVSATTDQFKELARMQIFDAKTWNHPVVVGNVLLVRNGEEMAAYRLKTEGAATSDAR